MVTRKQVFANEEAGVRVQITGYFKDEITPEIAVGLTESGREMFEKPSTFYVRALPYSANKRTSYMSKGRGLYGGESLIEAMEAISIALKTPILFLVREMPKAWKVQLEDEGFYE